MCACACRCVWVRARMEMSVPYSCVGICVCVWVRGRMRMSVIIRVWVYVRVVARAYEDECALCGCVDYA